MTQAISFYPQLYANSQQLGNYYQNQNLGYGLQQNYAYGQQQGLFQNQAYGFQGMQMGNFNQNQVNGTAPDKEEIDAVFAAYGLDGDTVMSAVQESLNGQQADQATMKEALETELANEGLTEDQITELESQLPEPPEKPTQQGAMGGQGAPKSAAMESLKTALSDAGITEEAIQAQIEANGGDTSPSSVKAAIDELVAATGDETLASQISEIESELAAEIPTQNNNMGFANNTGYAAYNNPYSANYLNQSYNPYGTSTNSNMLSYLSNLMSGYSTTNTSTTSSLQSLLSGLLGYGTTSTATTSSTSLSSALQQILSVFSSLI